MNEREIDLIGEKESTWVHVAEPRDTLLIDFSPSTNFSLQQDAARVHADVMTEPGSTESYYGVGDLSNVKSWMWIFSRPGSERIDYFFKHCSTSFAVLGATSSERFARMRPVFRAIAESVRPSCS